jgi:hypothetical protein
MAACLFQYGITHEFTVSGNPQQNGASERLGVIIWENAESFRKLAGLPAKFWPEMIKTANYIRMRSPQARVQTTPYEAWNGERQWLAYLRYGMGDADASITDILTRLDWDSLGSASVAHSFG